MNMFRFFCCLFVVVVIRMTIVSAKPESIRFKPENSKLDSQLRKYSDFIKNYYTFGKTRYGKRNDAAPMMESNVIWEILNTIQNMQKQDKGQKQESVIENKERIFRDFPNLDVDEYMSDDAVQLF